MRTRIIAVLNQKGGVGKTTTCVNLGAAIARRGRRVLLVDMDPQANLTVHLGSDFRQVKRSTYTLLLGEHALAPAVIQTADPNLCYVPSTLALANAEIQLASAVGRELLLREAIEVWIEDQGDTAPEYVFIDCPPSLGILTMNALCSANEVLLPIQCEFFALQGVAGILESLKAVQRLNRGLELSMVVPCMVDRRKTLARDVIEEVQKYFGSLVTKTRIRNNVKLAEAPSHGMTIFQYDASSHGAEDYLALAGEVLGELKASGDAAAAAAAAPAEAVAEAEPATQEPVQSSSAETAEGASAETTGVAGDTAESAPEASQDPSPPQGEPSGDPSGSNDEPPPADASALNGTAVEGGTPAHAGDAPAKPDSSSPTAAAATSHEPWRSEPVLADSQG